MNRSYYKRLKKQAHARQTISKMVAMKINGELDNKLSVLIDSVQVIRNVHYKFAIWLIENAKPYYWTDKDVFTDAQKAYLSRLKQSYSAALGGKKISRDHWIHMRREAVRLNVEMGKFLALSHLSRESKIEEQDQIKKISELLLEYSNKI